MRGQEDDKKRVGWSRGIECAEEQYLLCHKEEGRGSEGEKCREGSLSTEGWANVREFDQLEW
jgi:hypothetical protein